MINKILVFSIRICIIIYFFHLLGCTSKTSPQKKSIKFLFSLLENKIEDSTCVFKRTGKKVAYGENIIDEYELIDKNELDTIRGFWYSINDTIFIFPSLYNKMYCHRQYVFGTTHKSASSETFTFCNGLNLELGPDLELFTETKVISDSLLEITHSFPSSYGGPYPTRTFIMSFEYGILNYRRSQMDVLDMPFPY